MLCGPFHFIRGWCGWENICAFVLRVLGICIIGFEVLIFSPFCGGVIAWDKALVELDWIFHVLMLRYERIAPVLFDDSTQKYTLNWIFSRH